MTDPVRSRIMRSIKSRDTKPEMAVRRTAHAMGFRYRLHRADLPGSPDLVFPSRRAVVFVHGCFWHGHGCKRGRRAPKTNASYWTAKIARNRQRDREAVLSLRRQGWRVLVLWECQLSDADTLDAVVARFLG